MIRRRRVHRAPAGRAARAPLASRRLREPDPARPAQPARRHHEGGHTEVAPRAQRPAVRSGAVALDGLSRREHFTDDDDLVFCTVVGGHLNDDNVRDAFYAALEAAGLGHLRDEGPTRSSSTICGTRSARSARRRGSTSCGSRRGWGTRTWRRCGYLHYVPQHDDAARLTAAFTAESVPPTVPRTGTSRRN